MTQDQAGCGSCLDYIERRRAALIPAVGRLVQQQDRDVPPARFVSRLMAGVHRRHLRGRSLEPVDDWELQMTPEDRLLRAIFGTTEKENPHD